jgi:hypothetical protein
VATKTIGFFKIPAPYPSDVQPNYTVTDAAGLVWQVNDVRPYDWTLQIDVELVF